MPKTGSMDPIGICATLGCDQEGNSGLEERGLGKNRGKMTEFSAVQASEESD